MKSSHASRKNLMQVEKISHATETKEDQEK